MTIETAPIETAQTSAPVQTDVYGRPSLDSIMGELETGKPEAVEADPIHPEGQEKPADDMDAYVKEARRKFLEKQALAKKKKEDEDKTKQEPSDADIEALLKSLDGDEAPSEDKKFTEKDVAELVRKEIEQMKKVEKDQEQETQVVTNFKNKISEHIKTEADKYPIIEATGNQDMVYDLIEQDYIKNQDMYGQEWAIENMMDIGKAAEAVQKHLAKDFESMLKSDSIKKFILQYYNLGDQKSHEAQKMPTLSSNLQASTSTPKPDHLMSESERMAEALSLLN